MRRWLAMAWVCACACVCVAAEKDAEGWYTLFDGKSLDGWKASEKSECFIVKDGMLWVEGGRSHLFYVGDVEKHNFKNFELKLDVMTKPGANSGVYFHTAFQEGGWPARGFECQVNQTHSDPKKTGSLYNVKNVMNTSPVKDDEWWTYDITVQGDKVTIKVNDVVVNEVTFDEKSPRKLSSGTFCLQAHDPKSKTNYKNIKVKPLPE